MGYSDSNILNGWQLSTVQPSWNGDFLKPAPVTCGTVRKLVTWSILLGVADRRAGDLRINQTFKAIDFSNDSLAFSRIPSAYGL